MYAGIEPSNEGAGSKLSDFGTSLDGIVGILFATPMFYVGVIVLVVSLWILNGKNADGDMRVSNFYLRMLGAILGTSAVFVLLQSVHIVAEYAWMQTAALLITAVVCIWLIVIALRSAEKGQRVIGAIVILPLVFVVVFLLDRIFPEWGMAEFGAEMKRLIDAFGSVLTGGGS